MVAVCPLVPWPPADGGRKRTLRLLEAAERVGLVPHVLTADGANPEGVEVLRRRGWTVELLEPPPSDLRARLSQQLRRLPSPYQPRLEARLRELVAEAPTLVQIEHTQSAYYAAALEGTPWILSVHNVDSQLMRTLAESRRPLTADWLREWNRWQAMRAVERRAGGAATAVLCVSENDRRTFGAVSGAWTSAPTGSMTSSSLPPPVRRLPPGPPPAALLRQARLRAERARLRPLPARGLAAPPPAAPGAPPASRRRRCLARAAGGRLGRRPESKWSASPGDLVAELAASDALVVPLWAGGGTRLKVLEAMAAAVPIVGTGLGVEGIGFEDGMHGLVRDTPEELAAGLDELLADRERAVRMAAVGRALAEDFRWSRALAPAEALFRELAETQPARSLHRTS